jgi:hypothetical protein
VLIVLSEVNHHKKSLWYKYCISLSWSLIIEKCTKPSSSFELKHSDVYCKLHTCWRSVDFEKMREFRTCTTVVVMKLRWLARQWMEGQSGRTDQGVRERKGGSFKIRKGYRTSGFVRRMAPNAPISYVCFVYSLFTFFLSLCWEEKEEREMRVLYIKISK